MRLLAVILLLLSSLAAEGLVTSDKIAAISVQRILNETIAGKAIKQDLEVDLKKNQLKLDTLRNDLKKLQEGFKSKATVMSDDAKRQMYVDIQKKEMKLQEELQSSQSELAKKHDDSVVKVLKEVQIVLDKIAKKEGLDFVYGVGERLVVYAAPQIDLTDRVIKILDDKKLDL